MGVSIGLNLAVRILLLLFPIWMIAGGQSVLLLILHVLK